MHPELQENGRWVYPTYTEIVAPCWRVRSWEDLKEEDRKLIQSCLEDALQFFCFSVDDIELCGSRAFGCANEMSDFDFNLVVTPVPDPISYKKTGWWIDFVNRLNFLSHQVGVRIEAAPTVSSQKETNCIYSFKDMCFYGKKWGEYRQEHRKWDPDQKIWIIVPFQRTKSQYEVDLWLNK